MEDNAKHILLMKIHREGLKIITISGLFLLLINFLFRYFFPEWFWFNLSLGILSLLFWAVIIFFFRVPKRLVYCKHGQILAPADGKVVVIEKTFEKEFFNDERIQISIFMSPLNVHINWIPVSGMVSYTQYHPGTYVVAWKPKASEENERFTTVVKTFNNEEILIRQIAGKLARRIVTYSIPEMECEQGQQLGFIKFGSRVDIFLPLNTKINVQLNQKVKGNKTIIAEL
jgi:phosphatidylserine decarboxylase